tara:strand:+ start:791 stop:1156 length:366 start_codon:yes stop_codon:yes gene_type:complete
MVLSLKETSKGLYVVDSAFLMVRVFIAELQKPLTHFGIFSGFRGLRRMRFSYRLKKDILCLYLSSRAVDLAETVLAFHFFCHCFLFNSFQCKKARCHLTMATCKAGQLPVHGNYKNLNSWL